MTLMSLLSPAAAATMKDATALQLRSNLTATMEAAAICNAMWVKMKVERVVLVGAAVQIQFFVAMLKGRRS